MRLFMRHPLLGQTAAEMSRAVIIELPRASSLRGREGEGEADCLVPGIRRAGVPRPKIAPNFLFETKERERENCWKRSVTGINSGGREEEGCSLRHSDSI